MLEVAMLVLAEFRALGGLPSRLNDAAGHGDRGRLPSTTAILRVP